LFRPPYSIPDDAMQRGSGMLPRAAVRTLFVRTMQY
jgi:hypothetical protein